MRKWDGNSNFASDIYGAHVIFMHVNIMEMCGDKLANWLCRRHAWRHLGLREVLGDSCMHGGLER